MLQAVKASPVTPMARVPWLSAGDIMKALDAGALGIICPMINNTAPRRAIRLLMRYPPHGQRSFGPTRAIFAHGADYAQHADSEILALAMIETADGMKNLEEIVSTPASTASISDQPISPWGSPAANIPRASTAKSPRWWRRSRPS